MLYQVLDQNIYWRSISGSLGCGYIMELGGFYSCLVGVNDRQCYEPINYIIPRMGYIINCSKERKEKTGFGSPDPTMLFCE